MNGRALLVACLCAGALVGADTGAAEPTAVGVGIDRNVVTTRLGQSFVLRSRITNHGHHAVSGLVAHLNVLSLSHGLYVDPEDWSSHRTRYLAPMSPGASITLAWKVAAVNAGDLGIYIAVMKRDRAGVRPGTSPLVRVAIADRRSLDAGGILPLALGIPAILAAALLGLRIARRRAVTTPVGAR